MHAHITSRQRSLALVVLLALACAPSGGPSVGGPTAAGGPPAIDPQQVQDQDDMTWADYKPIPGTDWANPAKVGTKKVMRLAIVTADFEDEPFVLTLPKFSDLFGNPQIDPVKREQIPQFYVDFYNKPNEYNHGHTVHEYWMEQSHGQVSVVATAFGPYRMPKKAFQYGGLGQADMPAGYMPSNRLSQDIDSLWRKDAGDSIRSKFDVPLRLYAGYDETATWQEFGEMKFQTKEDIPKEWGNPDTTKSRWVNSRYGAQVPWKAGEWLWSNSTIVQGASINSIRHEISHFAFSIGDNYSNPFALPRRRTPAGPWELMDRGSFNGPGGPHRRWLLPPNEGGSMSAGLMLRQRLYFGFVDSLAVLKLNRDGLAKSGLAVADVTAREIDPLPGTLPGIVIRLDGAMPHDRTPVDDPATNPLSSGVPNYDFYTMEVVQRMGYDSYTPDNGVLIAKNKDRASNVGGPNSYSVFTWTIDANPQDINHIDFKRPNGEVVMRSIADYRQLNDALFHAGLNSKSQYEWEDTPNRLHFYIVDIHRDTRGVRSYTLAVRSLDGAGPQRRGVSITAPAKPVKDVLTFTVTNTGAAAPVPADAHPHDVSAYLGSDVYRLSVSVEGAGWQAQLTNVLAAVKFGGAQQVPVYVQRDRGAAATAVVTVTATSESDPTKTATARYTVRQ